jgi:broad specificity phosphatase PhoE
MPDPTVLHFVRHGNVQNPDEVYYGRLPGFHLSDKGRRQAHVTAEMLRARPRRIAAVFSSPMLRATETAVIIIGAHGCLPFCISGLLNEACTPFDGMPKSIVAERNWDVYTDTGPGYEQPVDVLARAQNFVAEVREQYAGQHVVAITHGDVIAFLKLRAEGAPITPKDKQVLYDEDRLNEGSITSFVYHTTSADEIPDIEYPELDSES